jgi:hypothetical protein
VFPTGVPDAHGLGRDAELAGDLGLADTGGEQLPARSRRASRRLGVSDLEQSKVFYQQALGPLGYQSYSWISPPRTSRRRGWPPSMKESLHFAGLPGAFRLNATAPPAILLSVP